VSFIGELKQSGGAQLQNLRPAEPWSLEHKKMAMISSHQSSSGRKQTFSKFIDKVQRSREKQDQVI
jgi:hypothetical protein